MLRLFRHKCRLLALALALAVAWAAVPMARCRADDGAAATAEPSWTAQVRSKAGGWGLLTPVILFASRAAEAARMKDASLGERAGHATRFLQSPRFWGGLTADLAFSWLFAAVAAAMPGGVFLKTLVTVGSGFIGWEVGTGNLAHTDWINLFGQIVASSAMWCLVSAVLPGAGLVRLLASAATAIATGIVLDHLRGQVVTEAADPSGAKLPTGDPSRVGRTPRAPGSEPGDSREAYADLLEQIRARQAPGAALEKIYERYRDAQLDLQDARDEALADPAPAPVR